MISSQHPPVSVVIICRNAADSIRLAVQSAMQLTDDVVVLDTGSTDGTLAILQSYSIRLYEKLWTGYGATKNEGNRLAKYDWILSIDADEELDNDLIKAVQEADFSNENTVFTMRRLSYWGKKAVHFGEWGRSYIARLFNRKNAIWDESEVHEELIFKNPCVVQRLPGTLHHFTALETTVFREKLGKYAHLMAEKYALQGKKITEAKIIFSPAINFTKNYLLKGGFLDGKAGWQIAKANAWYNFQKYNLLRQRLKQQKSGNKKK